MVLKEQDSGFVYSDGEDFEAQMLALASQYPEDAAATAIAGNSDFAVNIAFSPVRQNLLNWYPFKPDADILEVGAGMGPLTGFLADIARTVTSLEPSQTRAGIIRARYPGRKNLTVASYDVTRWETPQRFDYIVVVGVLEYAGAFVSGEGVQPYRRFLQALQGLLKPGGIVLLAIENRFGLKYWVGGAEDHLLTPFAGIGGYQGETSVRTFTKTGLERLFESSGFLNRRFYYPLPDYKFPTAIYTDENLPQTEDLANLYFTYPAGSVLAANELDLYPSVLENGLFSNFANSFLVEASLDQLPQEHMVRVSAKGEFRDQYRTVTVIGSAGSVVKKAAAASAVAQVEKTWQAGQDLCRRGVAHLPGEYADGALETPRCDAPSASKVFIEAMDAGDFAICWVLLDKWTEAVEKSSNTTNTPSEWLQQCGALEGLDCGPLLENGYLDLNLFNAFWQDESLVFYDQEWCFPGLPLKFILWYGIDVLFNRLRRAPGLPAEEIYRHFGISQEMVAVFTVLRGNLWDTLFKRMGDIYGGDGNCNLYSNEMTLTHKLALLNLTREQLEAAENALGERERHLELLAAENTEHIQERDTLLGKVDELQAEGKSRAAHIQKLDEQISGLRLDIALLAEDKRRILEQVSMQQSALEEKDAALEEKDAALDEKEAALAAKAAELDEKNAALAARDAHVWHLEDTASQLNAALNSANAQLAQVLSSRTWRFGNKLAGMARKVFRPGSRFTRAVAAPFKGVLNLRRNARIRRAERAKYAVPIVIPPCAQPDVSIIIPVYNEFAYSWDCIKSVVETSAGLAYEVILADDGSTDRTRKVQKVIKGLQVVRNKENLRFLRNCNHAAQTARGRYLVFLNNDTVVQPDWLGSLLRLMESDDTIAIAGSKILSPDGTLQEAGGIIWNDASGWNFGRGAYPLAAEYNYVKDVDYISGCAIMVRHDFWRQVGGFDERFAPAYYEDTDLAFQARAGGYRVVYQPLSVLTHFEGVTNGTDLSTGQKQHQVANQAKFLEKWAEVLRAEQYPPGRHVLRARDRTRDKKIVLVVDHYIPTYDQDAGSRSIYNYIKLFLASDYHVILIPDNFARTDYATHYEQMGVEVLYGDWYYLNWQNWVVDNALEFDLVFLYRPHISVKYMDLLRQHTRAKILYYGCDLHFLRELRQYEITGDEALLESSAQWRDMELELMRKADCALYPSAAEEAYINALDPDINILTLPIYVLEPPERRPYDIGNRAGLLFVGGFNHQPNTDAMLWFAEEVFPEILAQYPDMVLHIVGSHPPDEVTDLAGRNIVVHGFVSDERLAEFYETCRLVVAPLRYGAGMKGKVIEALEQGMPMVTTDIGAEGLFNDNGMLAIANEADAFAAAVCALYDDANKLSYMRQAGYDYIEAHFSRAAAWEILNRAFNMPKRHGKSSL